MTHVWHRCEPGFEPRVEPSPAVTPEASPPHRRPLLPPPPPEPPAPKKKGGISLSLNLLCGLTLGIPLAHAPGRAAHGALPTPCTSPSAHC